MIGASAAVAEAVTNYARLGGGGEGRINQSGESIGGPRWVALGARSPRTVTWFLHIFILPGTIIFLSQI